MLHPDMKTPYLFRDNWAGRSRTYKRRMRNPSTASPAARLPIPPQPNKKEERVKGTTPSLSARLPSGPFPFRKNIYLMAATKRCMR